MSQSTAPAGAVHYLSFQLGGLEYALEYAKVKELRQLKALERFAAAGEIVKGVAVSRGVIMPIVDMRGAVAGSRPPLTPELDVIILALSNSVNGTSSVVGVVVDGVTDALWLRPEQIGAIAGAGGVDYLIGIGQCGERRLILVDIERLMSVRASDAAGQIRQRGLAQAR